MGFFQAPLDKIAGNVEDNLYEYDFVKDLAWIELCSEESVVILICSILQTIIARTI